MEFDTHQATAGAQGGSAAVKSGRRVIGSSETQNQHPHASGVTLKQSLHSESQVSDSLANRGPARGPRRARFWLGGVPTNVHRVSDETTDKQRAFFDEVSSL